MAKKKTKKRVNISVDGDLWNKFILIADHQDSDASKEIRKFIKNYISEAKDIPSNLFDNEDKDASIVLIEKASHKLGGNKALATALDVNLSLVGKWKKDADDKNRVVIDEVNIQKLKALFKD
jgi:hypothetical protein